jgi:hypothetical protein
VLELNAFNTERPEQNDARQGGAIPGAPGAVMMSFVSDVEKALGKLDQLGVGGPPRRMVQPSPSGELVSIAAVLDPDGVHVLLMSGSITQRAQLPP